MQFKSSLARLAAFAFFLLSFSMLVCAAPAPAAGSLAVRDGSLVARTSPADQCNAILGKLDVDLDVDLKALVGCSKTSGCDCKPLLDGIVLKIDVAIKAILAIVGVIDVKLCIDLVIKIVVNILLHLSLCIGLTVSLCADLAAIIVVFLKFFIDLILTLDVLTKVTLLAQVKAAVLVYLNLCLSLNFTALLTLCGITW